MACPQVQRHLYLHMRRLVAERRKHSVWWRVVGFVEDAVARYGVLVAMFFCALVFALCAVYYLRDGAHTNEEGGDELSRDADDGWMDNSVTDEG